MTQQLHTSKRPGRVKDPKPPRRLKTLVHTGVVLAGLLALPKAHAQEPSSVQRPEMMGMAAMAAMAAAPKPTVVPKEENAPMTLELLRTLAKTSVDYLVPPVEREGAFATAYGTVFEGKTISFGVTVCESAKACGGIGTRTVGMTISVDGVPIASFNLEGYKLEFERSTHQKLKGLAVAVRPKSTDEGKALEIYIFGTYSGDRTDFDVNVPFIRSDYYPKYNQATEEERIVVSMR